ncbi:MAG TPA: hypothetical protein VMV93_00215 [Chloroflexota bacterium]|nr:hypothetical protein [Chloroflexota bacterium]
MQEDSEEPRDMPEPRLMPPERALDELYQEPVAVRARRDGLRQLGQRYRNWNAIAEPANP